MPRPREHDSEQVREATYRCFWEKGFGQTSMEDLRQSTGLDPRQFLRDYGSKQGVFVQALRDFSEVAALYTLSGLERGGSGLTDIQETLNGLVALDGEESEWGCLICTTAQDAYAMSDDEVSSIVRDYFARIETAYHKAVRRAVRNGELAATGRQQRRIARSLMATHVAIMMLKRSGHDVAFLKDVASQALEAL